MITRRLVVCLSLSQQICWGISYYLVGVFGEPMAETLGWSRTLIYSGFSGALVVMGLTSPLIGRLVDRHGGRPVMTCGSLLLAAGCIGLSQTQGIAVFGLSWLCLGLAMRMTLYEAAFAALARVGGHTARKAISQITLLGGLASTTFWPIGHTLAEAFGWRNALLGYAAFALLTIPLHLAIPRTRHDADAPDAVPGPSPLAGNRKDRLLAGALYAVITTLGAFLNSGMSAHMIGILSGLGIGAGLAVWVSTLRGVGQSGARLCEIVFGSRLSPLTLGMVVTAILPLSFLAGLWSGDWMLAGAAFALGYGAGNGLLTIVRGAQPLVLFDHRAYGSIVGRLMVPSFLGSALAPTTYAIVIDTHGEAAALVMSIGLALLAFACSAWLWLHFRR